MKTNPLEIYIHIPFCVAKCAYCDFLSAPGSEETKKAYVEALCMELKGRRMEYAGRPITSIFIGGGTPSCLPEGCIKEILDCLRQGADIQEHAEITIEVNPGTVTREKLLEYRGAGVNRISIGLQSTLDAELKLLGRIHDYKTFEETYKLVREIGFRNVNVDLMSGIPMQHLGDFQKSLETIVYLPDPPEHISAYSLIIEEGTKFYDMYAASPEVFVSEEEDRSIYHETEKFLAKYGYERYEISNYAKPGYACKHNIGYWKRTDYLGFGIGAASLMGEKRFSNAEDLKWYLENPMEAREQVESLSREDAISEYLFLGLRLCKGISKKEFLETFGTDIHEVYGKQITRNVTDGLLVEEEERIYLTTYGLDISNYVMNQFLL